MDTSTPIKEIPSDFFANSSVETIIEKKYERRICNSENNGKYSHSHETLNIITNGLISIISQRNINVYCFFCEYNCKDEYLLKEHLYENHKLFLENILIEQNITFEGCRFCQAKFYFKELLFSHLFNHHEEIIAILLQKQMNQLFYNCEFCPYKVLKRHLKLLIDHIFRKHISEFSNDFKNKYDNPLYDLSYSNKSPDLSRSFSKLFVQENIESICSLDSPNFKLSNKVKSKRSYKNSKIIKRLSFSPVTKLENERSFLKNLNAKSFSFFKLKKKIRKLHDQSLTIAENDNPEYRCGLCKLSFELNSDLLSHVNNLHNGLQHFFRAKFTCGKCKAKFYKNSFLIRHCELHHTPKAVRFFKESNEIIK